MVVVDDMVDSAFRIKVPGPNFGNGHQGTVVVKLAAGLGAINHPKPDASNDAISAAPRL
jgi:hypothetical protein